MAIGNNTIHFKHCKLIAASKKLTFKYNGTMYELELVSENFDAGKGVILRNLSNEMINTQLLIWLSVYIGEDFIELNQKIDTRHSNNRGEFKLVVSDLENFLRATERASSRSYPKWKKRLFEHTINYYCVALRSGVEMMPLTMGFFGMSMECVGNLVYGKNDNYFTLGKFSFNKMINTRFSRYKKSATHRADIKRWQSYINSDTKLVHVLRNAYYGHSLMHLKKDRTEVVSELRNWLVRAGHTKKDAAWWIKLDRLETDIQMQAAPLYKVGLRSSRLLIFMLLGFSTSIPFAEFDYLSMMPFPKGEPIHFDGMSITITDISHLKENT